VPAPPASRMPLRVRVEGAVSSVLIPSKLHFDA
jgi:hypothetical protein